MPLPIPRRDLRESAFRRYEYLIARACKESFNYNPCELSQRLKATTFCARIRDAIRAYKLYHYPSKYLTTPLPEIHIQEMSDGTVNLTTIQEMSQTILSMQNPNSVRAFMKRIQLKDIIIDDQSIQVKCFPYLYDMFRQMADELGIAVTPNCVDDHVYIRGLISDVPSTTPITFTDADLDSIVFDPPPGAVL